MPKQSQEEKKLTIPSYITITKKKLKNGDLLIRMEGRRGMKGEWVASSTMLEVGKDCVNYQIEKIICEEEHKFGKSLTDAQFNEYIVSTISPTKPECLGCYGKRFEYEGGLYCYNRCLKCEGEYCEAEWRNLESIARLFDERNILMKKYEYDRITKSEMDKAYEENMKEIRSLLTI